MSEHSSSGPGGRVVFWLVALGLATLLLAGWTYSLSRQVAAQHKANLARFSDNEARLDFVEEQLSEAQAQISLLRKVPDVPIAPVSIAERARVLELIEQSAVSIEDHIRVRKLPANKGFEFRFELKNTSAVTVNCSTPRVEMTRNDYPASETNPNLVEGSSPGDIGRLGPGASYDTTWATGEPDIETWMTFQGMCRLLDAREVEINKLATAAGVSFDPSLFMASFGSWTSTDTAR